MARQIIDLPEMNSDDLNEQDLLVVRDKNAKKDKRLTFSGLVAAIFKSDEENVFLMAHPVGSTYWNETDSRNPGTVWGGTWVALEGVVLGGISDDGDSPFNVAAGTIIGADTHTLTVAQMPSHNHSISRPPWRTAERSGSSQTHAPDGGTRNWYTQSSAGDGGIGNTGGGQSHNNIQRTLVGYLWKRTA